MGSTAYDFVVFISGKARGIEAVAPGIGLNPLGIGFAPLYNTWMSLCNACIHVPFTVSGTQQKWLTCTTKSE